MKNKIKRHGDWHLVPTSEDLKGELVKNKKDFVFAKGEATNHFHTIHVPKAEDMVVYKLPDGSYMVDLRVTAKLTHPEHSLKNDLFVLPGRYKLTQRREKDWFTLATRKVID